MAATADILSTKGKQRVFSSQTRVLDTRAKQQYNASIRLQPQKVHTPSKWDDAAPAVGYSGKYKGQYLNVAKDSARRHGIPENLFLRLVQQESGWNPRAVSHKGAIGLAQLMPGTANYLGSIPMTRTRTSMAGRGTWRNSTAPSSPGGWRWRPTMRGRRRSRNTRGFRPTRKPATT